MRWCCLEVLWCRARGCSNVWIIIIPIDSEKERTKEIEAQKEYMKTDEYVEEAAREKLGLVKDNEIVFQEEK